MSRFARLVTVMLALGAASSAAALDVVLTPFASGFDRPVVVTNAGDSRVFVVEKSGYIRVVESDGTVLSTPFLDIHTLVSTGNEQGLLGLVFHPNYASNGFFYVNYTDTDGDTQVVRYSVSGDPDVADDTSDFPILSVAQPFSNHNGGDLHFGPDGFLYISLGDGGSGCDPNDDAQDPTSLLGKLLRIDVNSGSPYAIPASNPYAGPDGIADEIWALGLRNPWRFSFDRSTGDLWIGDVGQNALEEIDFQPAASSGGQNYGWDCREGFSASSASGCSTTATCMPLSLFTEPVHDYSHGSGCSITGGYRYRGSVGALTGIYFFSDYCVGEILGLTTSNGGMSWDEQSLGTPVGNLFPTAFGEDDDGDLYVASDGGTVYRIGVASEPPACPSSPSSGCVDADKAKLNAKEAGDPSKNKLLWKWSVASSTADLGDPTAGTSYHLCVYAGTVAVDLAIGVSGGGSTWKATSTGFKYKDATAGGDGAFKMLLKGSTSGGKSKLLLKAKGANLDLDALPLNLGSEPLVTQLIRNDDPTCWEATFPAVQTDDGTVLKAKLP